MLNRLCSLEYNIWHSRNTAITSFMALLGEVQKRIISGIQIPLRLRLARDSSIPGEAAENIGFYKEQRFHGLSMHIYTKQCKISGTDYTWFKSRNWCMLEEAIPTTPKPLCIRKENPGQNVR